MNESNFFRRRALVELRAADRAITQEARNRRLWLAQSFLNRVDPTHLEPFFASRHVTTLQEEIAEKIEFECSGSE